MEVKMAKAKAEVTVTFKTDKSWPIVEQLVKNTESIADLLKKNLKTKSIDKNHAISVEVSNLFRENCSLLEKFLNATLKAV
jgi:hypothetical protein